MKSVAGSATAQAIGRVSATVAALITRKELPIAVPTSVRATEAKNAIATELMVITKALLLLESTRCRVVARFHRAKLPLDKEA